MEIEKNSCRQAEEILIQKIQEEISPDDLKLLSTHLQNCSACREFENSLKQMKSTAANIKEGIRPDPQTLKNLKSYFNKKHDVTAGFGNEFLNRIISFLRKPVPLYQAAVPILCAVLIIIFLKPGLKLTSGTNLKPQIEAVDLPRSFQENTFTTDWEQLIQHQKGISASEDSIFSKAHFSTM